METVASVILMLLGGALAAGVSAWALRSVLTDANRQRETDAAGEKRLRYGTGVRIVGILALGGGAAIALVGPPERLGDRITWALLVLFFGGGGLWVVLAAWREYLVVGPSGLRSRPIVGRERSIAWEEVERVRFSPRTGYLRLEGRGRHVSGSAILQGTTTLWKHIERHVPRDLWKEAREQFRAYRRKQYGRSA